MSLELFGYNDAINLLNDFQNDEYLLRFINKFSLFVEIYKIFNPDLSNNFIYQNTPLISNMTYYYNSKLINLQHQIYYSSKNKFVYFIINDFYCHSLFITLLSNPSAHVLFTVENNSNNNVYNSINLLKNKFNTSSIEYHEIDLSFIINIVSKFGFDLIIYNRNNHKDEEEYMERLSEISNKNLIIL